MSRMRPLAWTGPQAGRLQAPLNRPGRPLRGAGRRRSPILPRTYHRVGIHAVATAIMVTAAVAMAEAGMVAGADFWDASSIELAASMAPTVSNEPASVRCEKLMSPKTSSENCDALTCFY